MIRFVVAGLLNPAIILLSLLFNSHALAAKLIGRAILPADTFAPGTTSAQFKQTNRTVPFLYSQPVQGFSAAIPGTKPGTYLVISDNGFGSKANSPDYLLRIYALEPDFNTGKVFPVDLQTGERLPWFNRRSFLEISDRNQQVNFPIVADGRVYPNSTIPVSPTIKTNRLLTGGDFDIESFRRLNDGSYWVGDEFGPFLLHLGANGELLEPPISLPNFLQLDKLNFVKSPDHPDFVNLGDNAARVAAANLGGSRGFEGMAINTSNTHLYMMLEGALKADVQQNRLLIYEFDLNKKEYTGKIFSYRLESHEHAIGELTAINNKEFIVIERDHLQGDPNNPAFKKPAQFKRLYKINVEQLDKQGFVEKKLLVDLLDISDPKGIGKEATSNGKFTFPFVTIESVVIVDERTLLVINDNNYADSMGRKPGVIDNTEFITIQLDKPLAIYPSIKSHLPDNKIKIKQ